MQQTLKKVGLMSSILLSTFVSSVAYSATLNITTKYNNTGGGAGNLNTITDQINGNLVCDAVNTYANATSGCDMSSDPVYDDAGTPNNPSDDIPTGDLIIRTNDVFIVSAGFSWLGNVGEDEVTLTGTLPAGPGFIWDSLPGVCALPASNISADGKTMVCVRTGFDVNGTGTYAENTPFSVRVEGDAPNGSTPGDISFVISDAVGSTTNTDGVASVNGGPITNDHRLKITAAPRWNIDKSASMYTVSAGRLAADGVTPGWELWYNYTIEVDEVAGETETGLNPRLGNEALQGGKNAAVTFTDDVSAVSPNAEIITWSSNTNFAPVSNACDMDTYSEGGYPYPSLNAANPERSIQSPVGTMAVTCTQTAPGANVAVTVTGIDSSLTNVPTQNRHGGALPVNRAIAAVGVIRIFVPLSDVQAGADGIQGNGDDGTLIARNCMTNFNPVGLSGTPNFGGNGLSESENDNCRSITLNANSGSWGKNYRKGWSDEADQLTQWGGGTWSLPPTDASLVNSGDGSVTPDGVWGTYNVYGNNGGAPITNPVVCDVIDAETFEMTILDPATDNPATFVDDRIHAVDLNYLSTENVAGIKVQYATGYVGSWPPTANASPNPEVATECNIPDNQWFDDIPAALAAGGVGSVVTKARLTASTLLPGQTMAMRIKHTARSTFLTSGAVIPNDTLLVNYGTYKSSLTGDIFRTNDYIANDATQGHVNTISGDRLIMVRAKARILKNMTPSGVQPGTDVTVTLSPSFTRDGSQANAETANVTIKDLLPIGMTYTNGTTTGSYGAGPTPYGEPTVISPASSADCATHVQDLLDQGQSCGNGESILIWDLGSQTTGTVYGDIVFHTIIDIDAPSGIRENYVLIESPADSSPRDIRIANANVINTVPTSLIIVKEVLTPLHEVNSGGLLNWMDFRVGLRNGSNTAVTGLDVIDILPFNGDGVLGSFTFTPAVGVTVDRQRVPATSFNGTFEFDDVSMDLNGQCTGTPSYWFTDEDPTTTVLDTSPLAPSNAIPGALWCGGDTTVAGSLASCGFAKSAVTAVRVRDVGMDASGTCFVGLKYATNGNSENDIYANTVSARVIEVNDAVLSNTVSARVYAGSIGNEVWHDMNNDGNFDVGEELANVTVRLTPPAGVDLGAGAGQPITTTTDANGIYLFDQLPTGDYTVEIVENSLPVFLRGNNTVDPDGGNNSTAQVALGADEDNELQDFAYYQSLGSIGDKVWNDINNDGVFDVGEGLTNITVTLVASGIDLGAGVGNPITTSTDANGDYLFPNLPAGSYTVTVDENDVDFPVALQGKNTVDPDGGNDSASQVTLAGGQNNLDQDFAYYTPASIGDTVWHDVNNNGVADPSEGIPDITVTLTLPDGSTVTTSTDTDGKYVFEDLPAGDYTVTVDENDVDFPVVLQGNNTVDPDGGNDSTSEVTLTGNGSNFDQDFAYVALGSIGDTIWQDDYDGVLDAGDTLLDGVTVTLTPPIGIDLGSGDGVAITQVTAGGGQYLFDNLPPGDYVVIVDTSTGALPGLTNVVDPDGGSNSTSNVTLAEGQNNLDQDFAYVAFGSITGQVLEDANDDGVGDAPIEGVLMRLLDINGNPVLDLLTGQPITALTDTNGNYTFSNLVPSALYSTPGDYQIQQVQPSGFGSVSDVEGDGLDNMVFAVAVSAGAPVTGRNFVEKRLPPTAVPTLSEWALILLMMMLGIVGIRQANTRGGIRF